MITLEQQRKVSDLRSSFERLSTHSDSHMADKDQVPVPFTPNTIQAVENALSYFDSTIDEEGLEDPKGVEHSEINMSIENSEDDIFPIPHESVASINSGRPSSVHSEQHSKPPSVANSPRESTIEIIPRNSSKPPSVANSPRESTIEIIPRNSSKPPSVTNSPRESTIEIIPRNSSNPPSVANSPRESTIEISPRNSSLHESIQAVTLDASGSEPPDSPRVSQVGSANALHSSVENVQVTVTNHNGSTAHTVSEDLTPEPFTNSQLQISPPPPEVIVTNNNTSKLDRQTMKSYENYKKRERKLDKWQRSLILGTGLGLILIVLVIVVGVLVIVFVNAGLQEEKPVVTFQVLDGGTGRPGLISNIRLLKSDQSKWSEVGTGSTDENGQIKNFRYTFVAGDFKIAFQNTNGNSTEVDFTINTASQHVFVPVILNAKYNANTKTACGAFTGDGLP